MELGRLNLNLLFVLDALIETRQVTEAARRLGMTQPATSMALSKLRQLFNDELLVSVGRTLQLTPKAEALRVPLKALIESMEEIFRTTEFSPGELKDEFVIATADYMSVVLLPYLVDTIGKLAPHLTLRLTNLNRSSTSNLKGGEIDMILAPAGLVRDPDLVSRHIFDDRLVVAYRREPGAPERTITLEEYLDSDHITTVIDSLDALNWKNSFVREIDDLRARQRNVAVVPYYTALPLIAANSSLLALVQERLVQKFTGHFPVAYATPPVALPPLNYAMLWNPRVNRDPKHRWMRDTISSVCDLAFGGSRSLTPATADRTDGTDRTEATHDSSD